MNGVWVNLMYVQCKWIEANMPNLKIYVIAIWLRIGKWRLWSM
jgi:hypothetical protein